MLNWDVLHDCTILETDTHFGNNVLKFKVRNNEGKEEWYVIDTEAIGMGLCSPVLYPLSDYTDYTVNK